MYFRIEFVPLFCQKLVKHFNQLNVVFGCDVDFPFCIQIEFLG